MVFFLTAGVYLEKEKKSITVTKRVGFAINTVNLRSLEDLVPNLPKRGQTA